MKFLKPASLAVAFFAVSSAQAATFETNFTADNFVTGFEYSVDGVSTVYALDQTGTMVQNSNDNSNFNWRNATNLSIADMTDGTNYQFTWTTQNDTGPAGFLADFTLNGVQYFSDATTTWELSTDNSNWLTASIADQTIWNSASPAVDANAQWIWKDSAANNETVYVRASITSAVPEPSTYALMLGGLGLVGFMAARRKKTA